MPASFDRAALEHLIVALLGGLAVGIERQWSGKAEGPLARFAGIRTFTLLGLVAGLSGWLWTVGLTGPAIIFLAGLGALVVIAYQAASKTDIDGTTEVSAFVVLAAGVLAGAGYEAVASGIIAVTLLFLVEKRQLHRLVKKLDVVEIRAGARFAVMAAVVLPLLPQGPFGPFDSIRPRQLWELVLFFSGLSFLGFLARRAVGRDRGLAVTGLLGGMVSSTSVTLTYSRLSRDSRQPGLSLAAGVLGANGLMFARILVVSVVLEPRLAAVVWPAMIAPALIGFGLFATGVMQRSHTSDHKHAGENPLQISAALQMALLFQVVLLVVAYATFKFGQQGLLGSAIFVGIADIDALTLSMTRATTSAAATAEAAAFALILGTLVHTVFKLTLALFLGRGGYRVRTAVGLAAMAVALGTALVLLRT